jgi:hypothetical protein
MFGSCSRLVVADLAVGRGRRRIGAARHAQPAEARRSSRVTRSFIRVSILALPRDLSLRRLQLHHRERDLWRSSGAGFDTRARGVSSTGRHRNICIKVAVREGSGRVDRVDLVKLASSVSPRLALPRKLGKGTLVSAASPVRALKVALSSGSYAAVPQLC